MLLNLRPELIWRGLAAEPGVPSGPLWAEAGRFVPFGQIHGHSAIVGYQRHTWHASERVRQRAAVDWQARHVRVRIGGRQFIGVDPKHGSQGAPAWRPLLFDHAEVIAAAML